MEAFIKQNVIDPFEQDQLNKLKNLNQQLFTESNLLQNHITVLEDLNVTLRKANETLESKFEDLQAELRFNQLTI